ncbi:MAG TPA: alkyl sulfatase dimerization domain-containing protein [Candidatus Limnocylindrales bacterium]|nr:alkyl sulfatase dimerization domain-containing protein [Candidatus Limnocylindrales bacterium]
MAPQPRWLLAAGALCAVVVSGCGERSAPDAPDAPAAPPTFVRQVVEVTPSVHVATGYGLANSVMIRGQGGVIIVDAMESAEAAAPVREAFRAISPDPVRAILYTHNHADHVFGAAVMAGEDHPEILSHASLVPELQRLASVTRPAIHARSMRQFGTLLPPAEAGDCGIGPRLHAGPGTTSVPLLPTRTFDGERLELEIAGVRMQLVHAPGETPDHIFVWLPEQRVLLPGDNYYHAFPNLYAIRGTAYRDVTEWVASIDAMRELRPAFLIPGHTAPVIGEADIHARLTDYRDAIQFVHDQTVRAMNDGLTPEEAVARVRLPRALADKPYLAERYGRVDWSVRGIYAGYLGWFGGNAAELSPLPAGERARRVAALAGGSDALRNAARAALDGGDVRWALELADHLLALGELTAEARQLRAAALRSLASQETSANGRNYYLTQALEAEEKVVVGQPDPATMPQELLDVLPVEGFLRAMTVRFDPEKTLQTTTRVGFRFTDTGGEYGLSLRNGVAEFRASLPPDADMTVTTHSQIWKEIVTRKRNATAAFVTGDVSVDRNRLELAKFLLLFR